MIKRRDSYARFLAEGRIHGRFLAGRDDGQIHSAILDMMMQVFARITNDGNLGVRMKRRKSIERLRQQRVHIVFGATRDESLGRRRSG